MSSVNKALLIGHVVENPDIRSTEDGKELANFSIATNEIWKNKDGTKKQKAEFHRIVVFSQGLVGIVKNYIKKGSKLYIEGQLQTRKWTDKQGNDRYNTEIILQGFNSRLLMLDSKGSQDNTPKMSDHDSDVFNELEDEMPY